MPARRKPDPGAVILRRALRTALDKPGCAVAVVVVDRAGGGYYGLEMPETGNSAVGLAAHVNALSGRVTWALGATQANLAPPPKRSSKTRKKT